MPLQDRDVRDMSDSLMPQFSVFKKYRSLLGPMAVIQMKSLLGICNFELAIPAVFATARLL
jgi:hypothetical protein